MGDGPRGDGRGRVQEALGLEVHGPQVVAGARVVDVGHALAVVADGRLEGAAEDVGDLAQGLGLGVKDWRAVIIFDDAATMDRFVHSGWDFGGDVEATAATADIGERFSRSISVQGMTIFTFTLHGLAAEATVSGTKYWPDDELN